MLTCPKCGEIAEVGRFCGKCGYRLLKTSNSSIEKAKISLGMSSSITNHAEYLMQSDEKTLDVDKLTQEIKKHPGSISLYLKLAEALLRAGKIDRAHSTFRAAKAMAPDDIRVFRLGGRIYEALGRIDDAIRAWKTCVKLDNSDIDAALQTARLLFETGRRQKALLILEKLKEKSNKHPEILLKMAEIRLSLGDYVAAQEDISFYRKNVGETQEMFRLLGRTMLLQNFFDGAIKTFNEGLARYPNDPQLLVGLGKALLGIGEKGQALLEFERAARLAPDHTEILLEMGKLYGQMGLEDKMEETFEKIRCNKVSDGEIFLEIAKFYQSRNQFNQALEDVERARKISPHHPDIIKFLCEILEGKREFTRALSEYEAFLEGGNSARWVLEGIIRVSTKLNDFKKKAWAQKKLIQLGNPTADLWCDLGESLIRLGKFDEAASAFEEAAKLDPSCVRAYQAPELIKIEKARAEGEKLVNEAREALKKRFFMTAVERLERALSLVPSEISWLKLLAQTNLKMGSLERASERLSRVRAAEPHDFQIGFQLARIYEFEDKIQLAIELLSSILKDKPEEVSAHIMLFKLKKTIMRGERLAKEMLSAIVRGVQAELASLGKKSPIPKLLEGYIYYIFEHGTKSQIEAFKRSEELFEEVLYTNPEDRWAHTGLSLIYRTKGDVKKAAHHLQEIVKLSSDPEVLYCLARLYQNFQNYDEAKKYYLSLRNLFPENGFYRKRVIEMMAQNHEPGKKDELSEFLVNRQNELRTEQNPVWILYEIGCAQTLLARKSPDRDEWIKKAMLTWNKAVSLNDPPPWVYWGQLETQIEFLKGSERIRVLNQNLKVCEKFLREIPDQAAAHLYLGRCYLGFQDLAQTDKAVRHLETAVFLEPNNAENWLLLGQTYRELGKSSRVTLVKNSMILLEPEIAIKL